MHPRIAWAFLRRDFKIATSYRAAFVMQIASIFIAVPLFYFMGGLVDGANLKALDA
jgi:hypothetical protein